MNPFPHLESCSCTPCKHGKCSLLHITRRNGACSLSVPTGHLGRQSANLIARTLPTAGRLGHACKAHSSWRSTAAHTLAGTLPSTRNGQHAKGTSTDRLLWWNSSTTLGPDPAMLDMEDGRVRNVAPTARDYFLSEIRFIPVDPQATYPGIPPYSCPDCHHTMHQDGRCEEERSVVDYSSPQLRTVLQGVNWSCQNCPKNPEKRSQLNQLIASTKARLQERRILISSAEGQAAIKAALSAAGFNTGRSSFKSYDHRLLQQLPEYVRYRWAALIGWTSGLQAPSMADRSLGFTYVEKAGCYLTNQTEIMLRQLFQVSSPELVLKRLNEGKREQMLLMYKAYLNLKLVHGKTYEDAERQAMEGAPEDVKALAAALLGPVQGLEVYTMDRLLGPEGPGVYAPCSGPYAAVLNLAIGLTYRMWAMACIERVTDLLGMYRFDHHFKVPGRIIGDDKCLFTVQCASTSNKIAMMELPTGTSLAANLGILVSLVERCKRLLAVPPSVLFCDNPEQQNALKEKVNVEKVKGDPFHLIKRLVDPMTPGHFCRGKATQELSALIFWLVAEDYDKEVERLVSAGRTPEYVEGLPFRYWRARCRTIIPPGSMLAPYLTAWKEKWGAATDMKGVRLFTPEFDGVFAFTLRSILQDNFSDPLDYLTEMVAIMADGKRKHIVRGTSQVEAWHRYLLRVFVGITRMGEATFWARAIDAAIRWNTREEIKEGRADLGLVDVRLALDCNALCMAAGSLEVPFPGLPHVYPLTAEEDIDIATRTMPEDLRQRFKAEATAAVAQGKGLPITTSGRIIPEQMVRQFQESEACAGSRRDAGNRDSDDEDWCPSDETDDGGNRDDEGGDDDTTTDNRKRRVGSQGQQQSQQEQQNDVSAVSAEELQQLLAQYQQAAANGHKHTVGLPAGVQLELRPFELTRPGPILRPPMFEREPSGFTPASKRPAASGQSADMAGRAYRGSLFAAQPAASAAATASAGATASAAATAAAAAAVEATVTVPADSSDGEDEVLPQAATTDQAPGQQAAAPSHAVGTGSSRASSNKKVSKTQGSIPHQFKRSRHSRQQVQLNAFVRPVQTDAEQRLFLELYFTNTEGKYTDWQNMTVQWNLTTLEALRAACMSGSPPAMADFELYFKYSHQLQKYGAHLAATADAHHASRAAHYMQVVRDGASGSRQSLPGPPSPPPSAAAVAAARGGGAAASPQAPDTAAAAVTATTSSMQVPPEAQPATEAHQSTPLATAGYTMRPPAATPVAFGAAAAATASMQTPLTVAAAAAAIPATPPAAAALGNDGDTSQEQAVNGAAMMTLLQRCGSSSICLRFSQCYIQRGQLCCQCGLPMRIRVSNTPKNPGRRFSRCAQLPHTQCEAFGWLNEMRGSLLAAAEAADSQYQQQWAGGSAALLQQHQQHAMGEKQQTQQQKQQLHGDRSAGNAQGQQSGQYQQTHGSTAAAGEGPWPMQHEHWQPGITPMAARPGGAPEMPQQQAAQEQQQQQPTPSATPLAATAAAVSSTAAGNGVGGSSLHSATPGASTQGFITPAAAAQISSRTPSFGSGRGPSLGRGSSTGMGSGLSRGATRGKGAPGQSRVCAMCRDLLGTSVPFTAPHRKNCALMVQQKEAKVPGASIQTIVDAQEKVIKLVIIAGHEASLASTSNPPGTASSKWKGWFGGRDDRHGPYSLIGKVKREVEQQQQQTHTPAAAAVDQE